MLKEFSAYKALNFSDIQIFKIQLFTFREFSFYRNENVK